MNRSFIHRHVPANAPPGATNHANHELYAGRAANIAASLEVDRVIANTSPAGGGAPQG